VFKLLKEKRESLFDVAIILTASTKCIISAEAGEVASLWPDTTVRTAARGLLTGVADACLWYNRCNAATDCASGRCGRRCHGVAAKIDLQVRRTGPVILNNGLRAILILWAIRVIAVVTDVVSALVVDLAAALVLRVAGAAFRAGVGLKSFVIVEALAVVLLEPSCLAPLTAEASAL
jgi:hypothetical protein